MTPLPLRVFRKIRPLYGCRHFSLSSNRFSNSPKICIVGGGPAGFYAAQHLAKTLPDAEVDILESLPVPFGLVRFGVAPDHPEVKNVINTFTKTAQSPSVRFVGNVCVGKDVSLEELRNSYNAVLLTYGADEDRTLNIPGEDLDNVLSARRLVGWYNGVPRDAQLSPDLDTDVAVVLGQGNVALDVARILLTPVDALRSTDITDHALEALSRSRVERVVLVGRRGPLHVAFTIKELREMVNLPNCGTIMSAREFTGIPELIPNLPRSRKRLIELLCRTALDPRMKPDAEKIFHPVFLRSPLELLPCDDTRRVAAVRLAVNRMEEERAVPIGQEDTVNCGLVLRSIGYKSVKVDEGIPFDQERGLVPNQDGRVAPGLYVAGWLGTGPVGVILSTMTNAFSVARTIVQDLSSQSEQARPGYAALAAMLSGRGVQTVAWSGWERIDEEERERGKERGKPREKMLDVQEMLTVAGR